MKAVVAAFKQEKALVGAFSVITNLRVDLFESLVQNKNMDTACTGNTNLLHITLCLVSTLQNNKI